MNQSASLSVEKTGRQRVRRGAIQDAILESIALAGILIVATAAPNAARVFDKLHLSSRNPVQRFRERISKLKRKGLLKWVRTGQTYTLELTPAGRKYAHRLRQQTITISKPRRWDGMWRMVIFDIPERKRSVRDKVRHLLYGLGLFRLQDSVWVHPYDFEEILTILKKDLRMGSEMRYVLAAAIEWDESIREHFGL